MGEGFYRSDVHQGLASLDRIATALERMATALETENEAVPYSAEIQRVCGNAIATLPRSMSEGWDDQMFDDDAVAGLNEAIKAALVSRATS